MPEEREETGRWLIDGLTVYELEEYRDPRGRPAVRNRWSAHVQGGPETLLSEVTAAARKMAAAEEMHKALARLVSPECCPYICDANDCECGPNGTGFDDDGNPCEHIQACRALDKAEGK